MHARSGLTLIGGITMLALVGTAHANLITNGSFEDPAFTDGGSHYVHLPGTSLPGWTSYSSYLGTVLFNSLYDSVSEGNQAVQIEIAGDWISQGFSTVIGGTYALSFDLTNYSFSGSDANLGVTVGPINATFIGNRSGYATHTIQFAADSSYTTVKFQNLIGNYPELDNVSIVQTSAVPEPATVALLVAGLGVMGLAAHRRASSVVRLKS